LYPSKKYFRSLDIYNNNNNNNNNNKKKKIVQAGPAASCSCPALKRCKN